MMPFWNVRRSTATKRDKSLERGEIQEILRRSAEIPGWLAPEAACFTAHLLSYQKENGVTGNLVEIGVFKGKYLSILYQNANIEMGERVIGIDAFMGSEFKEWRKREVRANIRKACGSDQGLEVIAGNSLALHPETLLQLNQGNMARFISIDGGHTSDVVRHDLQLSIPILANRGIVAMDDVFNHSLPGVTQGLFEFVLGGNRHSIAPVAHCYNKLFLTTPDAHSEYYRATEKIFEAMTCYATYKKTKERIKEDRTSDFTPQLFGYDVFCFL